MNPFKIRKTAATKTNQTEIILICWVCKQLSTLMWKITSLLKKCWTIKKFHKEIKDSHIDIQCNLYIRLFFLDHTNVFLYNVKRFDERNSHVEEGRNIQKQITKRMPMWKCKPLIWKLTKFSRMFGPECMDNIHQSNITIMYASFQSNFGFLFLNGSATIRRWSSDTWNTSSGVD